MSEHPDKRRRKVCLECRVLSKECDGKNPCGSCLNLQKPCSNSTKEYRGDSPTLLNNNSKFIKEVKILKQSLDALDSIKEISNSEIHEDILDISNQLTEIEERMLYDTQNENHYSDVNTKSIEMKFVQTNSIELSNYPAERHGVDKIYGVNPYIGLYSPIVVVTKNRIYWTLKLLLANKNLDLDNLTSNMKNTKMLLNAAHKFSKDLEMLRGPNFSSPIDWYKEQQNYPLNVSNSEILDDIYNKCIQIVYKTKAVDKSKMGARKEVSIIELGKFFSNIDVKFLETLAQESPKDFIKLFDYLMILFFWYSSYPGDNWCPDYDVFAGMLSIFKFATWSPEPLFLTKQLYQLLRVSQMMGLNRWEFYLSLDEETAEKYRTIWWEIDWQNKWHAVATGKTLNTLELTSSCLYPKKLMSLNIDHTMDIDQLLDNFRFKEADDLCLLIFGRIILSKIISEIFNDILYNRCFTDYKLFLRRKRELIEVEPRLLKIHEHIMKNLELIQLNFQRILTNESHEYFQFTLEFYYIRTNYMASYLKILNRLRSGSIEFKIIKLEEITANIKRRIYDTSIKVVERVLNSTQKSNIYYLKYILYFLTKGLEYYLENGVDDPFKFVKMNLLIIIPFINYSSPSDITHKNSSLYTANYLRKLQQIFILEARLVIQVYLNDNEDDMDSLLQKLSIHDQKCATICKNIMDIKSEYYSDFI